MNSQDQVLTTHCLIIIILYIFKAEFLFMLRCMLSK